MNNSVSFSTFTILYNHCLYLEWKYFITPYPLICCTPFFLPPPHALANTNLFFISVDSPILCISYKLNRTIYDLFVSGFFYLAWFCVSFALYNVSVLPFYSWIILHCMYISVHLSIYILMNIWAFCTFWLLLIVLLWTCVYIIWVPAFSYFGYILRRGISGSYPNSVFSFTWNHQTVFHSGWTIFVFSSAMCEGSSSSLSSPMLVIFHLVILFLMYVEIDKSLY